MKNSLLDSLLSNEVPTVPAPVTPDDVESAGLELILQESEEDLEHANLVGEMVAKLADNVAGAEALLTANQWNGDAFARIYNNASVLANKLTGYIPNVLGGESFGTQADAQLAAAAGMEGIVSAVGEGLTKLWDLLVKAVKSCWDAITGIFKSKDGKVKEGTKKVSSARSGLPSGPITIEAGPLAGKYGLQNKTLVTNQHSAMTHSIIEDIFDAVGVAVVEVTKGSSGSVDPIMKSIQTIYGTVKGVMTQGKEIKKNGDHRTYEVDLGALRIEWDFMVMNEVRNEQHIVEFINSLNFRVFPAGKRVEGKIELLILKSLAVLDDSSKESARIVSNYIGISAKAYKALDSVKSKVGELDDVTSGKILRALVNKGVTLSQNHIRILGREIDQNDKAIDYLIDVGTKLKAAEDKKS